jgi:cob(I)alamin adenosyltransferase
MVFAGMAGLWGESDRVTRGDGILSGEAIWHYHGGMKIYTRTGDDGTTGLFGGGRVRKSDPRLECYGTVDELNAVMGLAVVGTPVEIQGKLRAIQNELFVIGAHLATPEAGKAAALPTLDDSIVGRLEMEIDAAEGDLPPLRQFILPGGTEAAARLHLARTVCRRAERLLVEFSLDRPVPMILLTYLNRLSDWLFVHARWVNWKAGVDDIPWEK